jgi:hypothetical protein
LAARDAFKALSAEEDYRSMYDPYWVRADPYRVKLPQGGTAEVTLHVRNFLARPQPYRIAVHCPEGIAAEPAVLEGTTADAGTVHGPLRLKAASAAKSGVQIVALDVTVDGKRYGEWFDFVVGVMAGRPTGTE